LPPVLTIQTGDAAVIDPPFRRTASWRRILIAALLCAGPASSQNQAIQCTGVNLSSVTIPHASDLNLGTFTVEAWVNQGANNNGYQTIIRKGSALTNVSFDFRTDFAHPVMIVKAGIFTLSAWTPVQVPNLSWHHLAATYDNANVRTYLDGVLLTTEPAPGPLGTNADPITIGYGYFEPWIGQIDCVRLWNYARTQAQIQQLMPYQISTAPGLLATWRFEGNLLDSTGNHHGSFSGPPTISFVNANPPFLPFVAAPAVTPIGAPLNYVIEGNPGQLYVFDISVTGTSPGISLPGGLVFPLNPPLLNIDTNGAYTSFFQNFLGLINSNGKAFPAISIPASTALTGIPVSAAFAIIDGSTPSGASHISPPVQTTIGGLAPSVNDVSPPTGPAAGGTTLTISGSGFVTGASVQVGQTAALGVSVISDTLITCLTPPGAVGSAPVSITNPDGVSSSTLGSFSYVPTLVLASVAPLVSPPGTLVTVTGSGIAPGATILIGGSPVATFSSSASTITFVQPASVACETQVTVTNPDGQSDALDYNPEPQLLFAPLASGPAAGGNTLTVFGSNFFPGTTATVGGAAAAITLLNPSVIELVVPAGPAGPSQVVVSSVMGCQLTFPYTYQ
jgi:hypothetical protein